VDLAGVYLSVALVLIFFGLPLFLHLGANDLTNDEPIYAFAVDRMLDQGDWLTPKSIPYDQAPFLEKPPLKLWIVAASMRAGLLPQNEFGHRFWDALFGVAAFLYVLAIGYRAGGLICGLTAVFVLFVHQPLILGHGLRSNNMEAALVLAYCGGIYHALAWSRARASWQRSLHPMAVGLWFVLGFMTKFVAAIFLPAILVVAAVLFKRWRRRAIEDWRAWAVTTVAVMVLIAPWFVYEYRLQGPGFWETIVGQHVLVRFTSYLDPAHLHPWYFYFTSAYDELQSSETWILVAAGLAVLIYRAVRDRSDDAGVLLLWFILPVGLISIGTSKLYHYIYPFLPPLAIAAGMVPAALLEATRRYEHTIVAWLERAWPARRVYRVPSAIRWMLIGIAAAAFVLAVVTPIFGSVTLRVGGVMLRNSTTTRPMLVSALLLALAGLPRLVPRAGLILILMAAMPFTPYRQVRAQLTVERAPVRQVRDCLLRLQKRGVPRGVYLHSEYSGSWTYFYYLREPGLTDAEAQDDDKLARRLFVPAEQRPVFLTGQDYSRFRSSLAASATHGREVQRLLDVPFIRFQDDRLILLPGEYAVCAGQTASADHR